MPGTPLITPLQLRLLAPRSDYMRLAPLLTAAALEFHILLPRELAHWLGQIMVECAGFTAFAENLDYSAERIAQVWPKRWPTPASVAALAHAPQALAEAVYGGRYGNNEVGDGWRFRGSGMLGHTFRPNFATIAAGIGVDVATDPDRLRQDPAVMARAAAWYWDRHALNGVVAAEPDDGAAALIKAHLAAPEDVARETLIINGGRTGLDLRLRQVLRARAIWKDS